MPELWLSRLFRMRTFRDVPFYCKYLSIVPNLTLFYVKPEYKLWNVLLLTTLLFVEFWYCNCFIRGSVFDTTVFVTWFGIIVWPRTVQFPTNYIFDRWNATHRCMARMFCQAQTLFGIHGAPLGTLLSSNYKRRFHLKDPSDLFYSYSWQLRSKEGAYC